MAQDDDSIFADGAEGQDGHLVGLVENDLGSGMGLESFEELGIFDVVESGVVERQNEELGDVALNFFDEHAGDAQKISPSSDESDH